MADRRSLVVDASVAGRWYVNNPPFVQEARRVQSDLDNAKISLVAPENLLHELTSTLHQAVIARKLNALQGREQLERFLSQELIWTEDY